MRKQKIETVGFMSNFDLERFIETVPKNKISFVNWISNEVQIKK